MSFFFALCYLNMKYIATFFTHSFLFKNHVTKIAVFTLYTEWHKAIWDDTLQLNTGCQVTSAPLCKSGYCFATFFEVLQNTEHIYYLSSIIILFGCKKTVS
jgi:hypothetical protein